MHRKRSRIVRSIILLLILPNSVFLRAQNFFPDTGKAAIHQRALELRSGFQVLGIALQPGMEDLGTLAYLKMSRGARIVTGYITNGEGGESDLRPEYPPYLAAQRREEAFGVLKVLDSEARFLNFPDVAAAGDTMRVRAVWETDSLQMRLMQLITDVKPDLIILFRDKEYGAESHRFKILRSDLLAAVRRVQSSDPMQRKAGPVAVPMWKTARVVEGARGEISVPVSDVQPVWKKSYRDIGGEARALYRSLAHQYRLPGREEDSTYRQVLPQERTAVRKLETGLPQTPPAGLQRTWQDVRRIAEAAQKGSRSVTPPGSKALPLAQYVSMIIDSVGVHIGRSYTSNVTERKALLWWKSGLESLRNTLRGVFMQYSFTETTLTELQVTYLVIDTLGGLTPGSTSEIYFPATQEGWIVNAEIGNRFPLTLKERYNLLSPREVEYTRPHAVHGIQRPVVGKPFMFFVFQRGQERKDNFVYRATTTLQLAPRFTTEVLTPIVRAVSGEQLLVRVTNNSRDGVADVLVVDDSLARSTEARFALNQKGQSHTDSLVLTWSPDLEEGDYIVPVSIAGIEVARFGARKFDAAVDTTKRVAVLTGFERSATVDALRRLGVRAQLVNDSDIGSLRDHHDVLIIDRRYLTLKSLTSGLKQQLTRFADDGGHLIILAQDADVWNANPILEGVTLSSTPLFDEFAQVLRDTTDPLMRHPNIISDDDFGGWLFRRAYHTVTVHDSVQMGKPVTLASNGQPLLVSAVAGRGAVTYVDLAFTPQWLNIHPGSYRLLGNLVSR